MKFISFTHDTRSSFGVLPRDGPGVIDLGGRLAGVRDLSDLLAQERLDEAREIAAATHDVTRHGETDTDAVPLDEITYERTLPSPRKIFCIGVNYGGRNAEYRDGQDTPPRPSVIVRFPESLKGHEHPLVRPPESEQLEYEGQLDAEDGRGGRRIQRVRARQHVAGLVLGNEGTIRDWVRHAKFNATQGKNWESSGAIGPWMVTLDEIGEFDDLHLTTHVNGELRQDATPASMAYPIEFQIEYLSTFCTLHPGDLIFTGTPTGAGARFDPPRFLAPGDVVEVSVPELGTLRNGVVDETA